MSNKYIENPALLFTDIADALREKTGETELIDAVDFPDKIKSVETTIDYINEDITFIGDYAYYGMNNIKSMYIPNVEHIGNYAFSECHELTMIVIDSVNTVIGESPFPVNENLIVCGTSKSSLESYTTENNIPFLPLEQWNISYSINDNVLAEFLPATQTLHVCGVGRSKYFNGQPPWGEIINHIRNIEIDDGITSIGGYAFKGCKMVKSVTIPDSVTEIKTSAFHNCKSLTSVTLPSNAVTIYDYAFGGCSSMKYVHIDSLISWLSMDFTIVTASPLYGNEANLYIGGDIVTEVDIPSGITEIKKFAFAHCRSLTYVTIPDSVIAIGSNAFGSCFSLTDIYYNGTMAQWASIAFSSSWDYNCPNYTVHCTDGDITKS